MQMNIDAFVVVQRNLEHGVEGFFHRAIDTGWVQPANVMRACLHCFTHQGFRFRQQQTVLREGDDFTLEARLTSRQHRLQILQIFQAGNRFDIAVAAGNGGAFRLQ